eukprot:5314100-Pleurochrysis_carterae.AAC.1
MDARVCALTQSHAGADAHARAHTNIRSLARPPVRTFTDTHTLTGTREARAEAARTDIRLRVATSTLRRRGPEAAREAGSLRERPYRLHRRAPCRARMQRRFGHLLQRLVGLDHRVHDHPLDGDVTAARPVQRQPRRAKGAPARTHARTHTERKG